ncbi:hypothetical protein DICPUDRAFT_84432 [Dictyostelium purpureum]|uniref:Uncharacterized protein n=1 Tax=Dictyostelium purpureum TaxID=5786 RepID=F1A2M2_DICPU|nr:uncharacterized protein DICPUDRAFT_84432 [Dictyostelium purpureum]EGC29567.1 hypothetical protein DICPUDRAFT_84432 [Dictyostelium purpureum]|eukprot:XP_003293916.1 hypothetical protein DICPUDRAFT_84432 [Dictyostelium purpureum]
MVIDLPINLFHYYYYYYKNTNSKENTVWSNRILSLTKTNIKCKECGSKILLLKMFTKNYQDLCNNFNLQFYGCEGEHISTIKVRSIFSITYNATKTNIKCKECGTKTTVKLVQNLKLAVESNRFFLAPEQLNEYIEKFQKSTWL